LQVIAINPKFHNAETPMIDRGIERAIGRLEAEAVSSQAQRAELFEKVSELREDMHRGFRELLELLTPLVGVPDQLSDHRQRIDVLKSRQERQSGALWAAGVFGGLIAGGAALLARLTDILKWIGVKG
jgi:septal ring factor EnvC (AmiA/AmiB activator)